MHQPRLRFLAALFAYLALVKLTPYILNQFGMSINEQTTIYPWNFSPVPAVCLFGAAFFKDRRWAFGLPLAAWLAGDLLIFAIYALRDGVAAGLALSFYPSQPFVYAGLAVVVCCGLWLRKGRTWPRIALMGVTGSTLFFLLTNLAMWALGPSSHSRTSAGLLACYIDGLPFYRNFLMATLGFSVVLFGPVGAWALSTAEADEPALRPVPADEPVVATAPR